MRRMIKGARQHPVVGFLFVAGVAATLFFAVRLFLMTVYWSDPVHRDQTIAGWMTPGYVAQSWHVPREVVGGALGLDPQSDERGLTLSALAKARGVEPQSLTEALEAAIAAHRADGPGQP